MGVFNTELYCKHFLKGEINVNVIVRSHSTLHTVFSKLKAGKHPSPCGGKSKPRVNMQL